MCRSIPGEVQAQGLLLQVFQQYICQADVREDVTFHPHSQQCGRGKPYCTSSTEVSRLTIYVINTRHVPHMAVVQLHAKGANLREATKGEYEIYTLTNNRLSTPGTGSRKKSIHVHTLYTQKLDKRGSSLQSECLGRKIEIDKPPTRTNTTRSCRTSKSSKHPIYDRENNYLRSYCSYAKITHACIL